MELMVKKNTSFQITSASIRAFIIYYQALDKDYDADLKALEKGGRLLASEAVEALSFCISDDKRTAFFTGIVRAQMRGCSYNVKFAIDEDTGDIEHAHCECGAGMKIIFFGPCTNL